MRTFNAINKSLGVTYVPHVPTDSIDDVEELRQKHAQNASEPSTAALIPMVEPRVPTPVIIAPTDNSGELSEDILDDYDTSRQALRELIQQGTDSMGILLQLAESSESPRAYEVATTMMNTIASISKTLMDVHKTAKSLAPKKEVVSVPSNSGTLINNQTNVVFSGNSADLAKLLESEDNLIIDG